MKKIGIFLAIGIVLMSSCKKVTNTMDVAPVPTGTLQGVVQLYDEFGNPLTNSSGVTVSLDSTSFITTTDNSGGFTFKNVPANTHYNFTYSKNGYPSYHVSDFQFILPGGNAPQTTSSSGGALPYSVSLYPVSSTTVQSLTVVSNINYFTINANIINNNTAYNKAYTTGVQVFISDQKDVSINNYQNIAYASASGSNRVAVSTVFYYSAFYPVGTTLYFVAYGSSGNYSFSYQSIVTGQTVYPNLNPSPSVTASAVSM